MSSARHALRTRMAILGLITILFGIIAGSTTQAAHASAAPQNCVQRTAKDLATYDKLAAEFVRNGELTQEQADLYRCHPQLALKSAPAKVEFIPSDKAQPQEKTALAAGCRSSGTIVAKYGTPTALVHAWGGPSTGTVDGHALVNDPDQVVDPGSAMRAARSAMRRSWSGGLSLRL